MRRLLALGICAGCAVPFIEPFDGGVSARDADAALDVGVPAACPRYVTAIAPLHERAGGVEKLIDTGEDRLLALVRTGTPTLGVLVDPQGRTTRGDFDFAPYDVTIGARAGDRIYFGGWVQPRQGLILFAPSTGGAAVTSGTAPEPFNRMEAAPGGAFELLAVGHANIDAALYRSDGVDVERLWHNPARDTHDLQNADILWLDAGRALIIPFNASCTGASPCLLRYDRASVVEEPIPLEEDDDRLSSLAQIPGLGVVMGTRRGRFWVRDVGPLPGSSVTGIIRAIRPFGPGFAAVTDDAVLMYDVGARRFCDGVINLPSGFGFVYTAAVLGDALFVSGFSPDRPMTVDVIRPE